MEYTVYLKKETFLMIENIFFYVSIKVFVCDMIFNTQATT
jgi:hypothetical protein